LRENFVLSNNTSLNVLRKWKERFLKIPFLEKQMAIRIVFRWVKNIRQFSGTGRRLLDDLLEHSFVGTSAQMFTFFLFLTIAHFIIYAFWLLVLQHG
jgi:hypothetical protein